MQKKLLLATLITCISATSYAYTIGANLTVENKTDANMEMIVEQPNHQQQKIIQLPAHTTIHDYMENGDTTGWLYQPSAATFTIKSNGKVYAQGRIAYYVGGSLGNKYTFLDAINTANGITIDPTYSCLNGGNNTLENSFIINGTPGSTALSVQQFPDKISCRGLKSSSYDSNYTLTCFNGNTTTFIHSPHCCMHGCHDDFFTDNDEYTIWRGGLNLVNLDYQIGKRYCGNWEESLPQLT